MLSETVYRGLTGERSVHLADWPDASSLPRDDELVAHMDTVREVCSAGHSVRKARELRARLPLASVTVAGPCAPAPRALPGADSRRAQREGGAPRERCQRGCRPRAAGQPVGARPSARRGHPAGHKRPCAEGSWTRTPKGTSRWRGTCWPRRSTSFRWCPRTRTRAGRCPATTVVVSLSLEVTPELEREGLARDMVRQVQEARKTAGLDVSDHIRLVLYFPAHEPELRHAVEEHRGLIAGETLADEIVFVDGPISDRLRATVADGRAFHIGIVKLPKDAITALGACAARKSRVMTATDVPAEPGPVTCRRSGSPSTATPCTAR